MLITVEPTAFFGLKVSAVLSADDVEAATIFTGIDGEPVIAIGDLMIQAAQGDNPIQLLARLRERVRELPTVDRGPSTVDGS
jgi:hypothetical protein